MWFQALRRMQQESTSSSPPGRIIDFELHNSLATKRYNLVLAQGSDMLVVEEGLRSEQQCLDSIALLISREGSALLASLVDGCEVETALDSSKGLPLMKSEPGNHYYLNPRPHDAVHFRNQSLVISITEKRAISTSVPAAIWSAQPAVSERLQVQSSVPKLVDDSTDEDGDGPLTPDIRTHDERIIASKASDDHTPREEAQVFSTAQERSLEGRSLDATLQERAALRNSPSKRATVLTGRINQVLETPVKRRVLRHDHVKTPVMIQLDAADKENRLPVLQETPQMKKTARDHSPHSSWSIQTQTQTRTSSRSHKRSHYKSESDQVQPSARPAKRSRLMQDPVPSYLSIQPTADRETQDTVAVEQPTDIVLTSTSFRDNTKMLKWLSAQGCQVHKDFPFDTTRLTCVVGSEPGEALPLTGKLLLSLAAGATIVNEDWLAESRTSDHLLPQDAFRPPKLVHADRSKLLAAHKLFITSNAFTALKRSWQDFEALALKVGATSIEIGSARKLRDIDAGDGWLFIGADSNDSQAQQIQAQLQCRVYNKDFLKESVVEAKLLLDEPALQIDFSALLTSKNKKR